MIYNQKCTHKELNILSPPPAPECYFPDFQSGLMSKTTMVGDPNQDSPASWLGPKCFSRSKEALILLEVYLCN